jgi:hypothetical protein
MLDLVSAPHYFLWLNNISLYSYSILITFFTCFPICFENYLNISLAKFYFISLIGHLLSAQASLLRLKVEVLWGS